MRLLLLSIVALAACGSSRSDSAAPTGRANDGGAGTPASGGGGDGGGAPIGDGGSGTADGGGAGVLSYRVGAAKVDITGPFAGSSTGYNDPGARMTGLAMRLYSRAFVIEDPNADGRVVAIATADLLHSYESIKLGVVKKLAADGYGAALGDANVMVTGTHTHSAPSNISWYSTYDGVNGVSGFDPVNYAIVVGGVARSIEEAYGARRPAVIRLVQGQLAGAAFNRAAPAYQANADASSYATDVDETMTLLRVDGTDGAPIGAIDWFGVHGTSLGIDNRREHGDNKGWAAYALE
ncbi:MAG TPA: neutral/alkaline non-lysosomal ceramidase N-terminal domain-containing protein, partial [Polyangiaceae bacterium]|nr:neutral/alkaline non-lysosomal ceramidase N-terminal domain-containing protein [Polyangiaceae bacterium]